MQRRLTVSRGNSPRDARAPSTFKKWAPERRLTGPVGPWGGRHRRGPNPPTYPQARRCLPVPRHGICYCISRVQATRPRRPGAASSSLNRTRRAASQRFPGSSSSLSRFRSKSASAALLSPSGRVVCRSLQWHRERRRILEPVQHVGGELEYVVVEAVPSERASIGYRAR
jgi:hypothetical protein